MEKYFLLLSTHVFSHHYLISLHSLQRPNPTASSITLSRFKVRETFQINQSNFCITFYLKRELFNFYGFPLEFTLTKVGVRMTKA